MFHNSLKDDSKKKKLERIKRAKETRQATWFKRKLLKEDKTNAVKKG